MPQQSNPLGLYIWARISSFGRTKKLEKVFLFSKEKKFQLEGSRPPHASAPLSRLYPPWQEASGIDVCFVKLLLVFPICTCTVQVHGYEGGDIRKNDKTKTYFEKKKEKKKPNEAILTVCTLSLWISFGCRMKQGCPFVGGIKRYVTLSWIGKSKAGIWGISGYWLLSSSSFAAFE